MKAQVLHAIGDLRYEDVPEPVAKAGEVIVRVQAAGICGSDVPRVYETGAHRMPLIPGHEFSGIVESVPESDTSAGTTGIVEAVPESDAAAGTKPDSPVSDSVGGAAVIGKRVGIFPLIPCRKCEQCRSRHYELCRSYDYTGSRRDGAFAERVAVPAANLIELPDNVTFEEAAMLEPMSVAVHAMRRGFAAAGLPDVSLSYGGNDHQMSAVGMILSENDNYPQSATKKSLSDVDTNPLKDLKIAVVGAGTIGLLLAMFLIDAGARRVFLIGNKESQKKRAAAISGDAIIEFCSTKETDAVKWLHEQTDGGAGLVLECVGKADTCAMAIECAAPMGTVVLMGNPYGDMSLARNTYWKILRNQLTLTGTWNSSFDIDGTAASFSQNHQDGAESGMFTDDWRYVLDRLKNGSVHPSELITHRLPLSELERGLLVMRDKTEDYCKIMIS